MNKEMLKGNLTYIVAAVLILLAILLMVFKAGTFVGFRRGTFGCQWGENYRENFAGERNGFFPGPMGMMGGQTRSHGLYGTIIKNDGNSLVINDENNNETVVLMDQYTRAFDRYGEIEPAKLQPESLIVVVGRPNDKGQVIAKIIRVEKRIGNLDNGEIPTTSASSTNK